VEGSCEHGNEPSGSIKFLEVLEELHNWRLLRRAQLHEWVREALQFNKLLCTEISRQKSR
jgi:hypothetical protein